MKKYIQFTKIYVDNRRKIIAYFRSTIYGNTSIAEDLTQDTFLKFWGYYKRVDANITSEIGLLYSIANSIRADYFRRSKISTIPLEDVENKISRNSLDGEINLDDFGFTSLEKKITLLKMHNFNSQETSKEIGIPASTVRNHLSSIKKKIKAYYSAE